MKNKIINVNKILTYPKELIEYFSTIVNKSKLNEENIYFIKQILNDYYFSCMHVSRLENKVTVEAQGIMRPLICVNEKKYVSEKCRNILLAPLKNIINYAELENEYNNLVTNSYKINEGNDYWRGKYSCVYYTMYSINFVKEKIDAEFCLANKYGGELIEELFVNKKTIYNNSIRHLGNPYCIYFYLSSKEIIEIEYLLNEMYKKYVNNEYVIGFQSMINRDILSTEIINLELIKTT